MKESTKMMIAFWTLAHVLCLLLACGNSDDPDDYYNPGSSSGGSSGPSSGGSSTESDELKQIRDSVLANTNTARSTSQDCGQNGVMAAVSPLHRNAHLDQAAQAHADDMSANEFVSHVGSDGSSFLTRVSRTSYSGSAVSENVGYGYRTAGAVVNAWVDSDGHCKALMSPNVTHVGIGYAHNPDYGHSWVQVFGR